MDEQQKVKPNHNKLTNKFNKAYKTSLQEITNCNENSFAIIQIHGKIMISLLSNLR